MIKKWKILCIVIQLTHLLVWPGAMCFAEQEDVPYTLLQNLVLEMDGVQHTIELFGKKEENKQPESWKVVVNKQDVLTLKNKDGLYDMAELELQDVLDEPGKEVILYRKSARSSGPVGMTILRPGLWTVIFEDPNMGQKRIREMYQIEYDGNYQVSFVDKKFEYSATIPLKPENYYGVEHLDEKLNAMRTWIAPIKRYELKHSPVQASKQISTIQEIYGISQRDQIATLITIYEYEESKQTYLPNLVQLFDANQKLITQREL